MKLVVGVVTGFALLGLQVAVPVAAEQFPSKTINVTNMYAPGGGTDLIMRAVGYELTEMWNVPVVVESKPGAGGTIAAAAVARQEADGYHLLITDISYSVSPSVYKRLAYDPLQDLTPIILLNKMTLSLIVNSSLKASSIAELISRAKKQSLAYSSAGVGTFTQLTMELFKKNAAIDLLHVPYRGAVPAVMEVMAGRADAYTGTLATPLPYILEGKIKALAVLQKERSPLVPDVPTIVEAGYPDLDLQAYYGLFAPKGTPRPIIDKLADGVRRALASPKVQVVLRNMAAEPVGMGPDEFAAFLRADIARWRKAVELAGLTPE